MFAGEGIYKDLFLIDDALGKSTFVLFSVASRSAFSEGDTVGECNREFESKGLGVATATGCAFCKMCVSEADGVTSGTAAFVSDTSTMSLSFKTLTVSTWRLSTTTAHGSVAAVYSTFDVFAGGVSSTVVCELGGWMRYPCADVVLVVDGGAVCWESLGRLSGDCDGGNSEFSGDCDGGASEFCGAVEASKDVF